jgi:hypothetical protein
MRHHPSLVRTFSACLSPFFLFGTIVMIAGPARAACPTGLGARITSGDPAAGPPVILTGLGAAPRASFFLLGAGNAHNSGTLPALAWLHEIGDVDGDGLPDYRVEAPADGPGGWGDSRTVGCPAFADPPYPPIVLVIQHDREDLDGDGKFDVFEDRFHNGILDPGEDLDGDGRLTPPSGCEGANREDLDCDGRLDFIDEDPNGNGICDPGEPCDVDNDGRLERGIEDRNHNQRLDDRPVILPTDPVPDENGNTATLYPYHEMRPSPGGVIVISIAWNGSAYNLQSITTPTTVLGPIEDLDHDGAFDVFEDLNRNGILDPGEDRDGDGRLTPPGGCEGVDREDLDCDGHLDYIDEDPNGNGVCDPGEPCDVDHDGHLDRGIEDRNHNQILDDRPFPSPADVIDRYENGQPAGQAPPTYPYGAFLPRPLLLLRATPLDSVVLSPWGGPPRSVPNLLRVTGVHLDPRGHLRVRLDAAGVALNDDLGGARDIYNRLLLTLPGSMATVPPVFAETGAGSVTAPSTGHLRAGAFVSIVTDATYPFLGPGPLDARGLSTGSDLLLASAPPWPGFGLPVLLDQDGDSVAEPYDNCPDVPNVQPGGPLMPDADHNGIGDACDPGGPQSTTVHDAWRPQPVTSPAPLPKDGAAAVYDAAHGVVVLFGGLGSDDRTTWEYDGGVWRPYLPPVAPEGRAGHRMAYDAVRRRVVLYGGVGNAGGRVLSDQWEYDAGSHVWSAAVPAVNPGPRSDFGLTYDSDHAALVLFGGTGPGGALLGDTWVYASGTWRRVPSPASPGARRSPRMTYDHRHRLTILAGGTGARFDLNDAWTFDGATWQPADYRGTLPPSMGRSMDYDPARRQAFLVGGIPEGAVRLYDGATWGALPTLTAVPRMSPLVAVFDSARNVLVASGQPIGGQPGDPGTWELVLTDDVDGDGVPDAADDCPLVANADQADADQDGSGDVCDNCPLVFNPDQRDLDQDLQGDACDPDRDGDGIANAADVCPDANVPGRPFAEILAGGGPDTDGDGIADDCDACPLDAANDADHDGLCGDVDNCPLAFNPMQQDSNGDGAGDACQPALRIVSIAPVARPFGALNAVVDVGDPDGDRIHGTIRITSPTAVPEVYSHSLDACASAFLPDGSAGEGLIYADVPGVGRLLADVDSNFGCRDGMSDFTVAAGTCAATTPEMGSTIFPLDRATPFPVCVRRTGSGGSSFDFVVYRVTADVVLMSGTAAPLIAVDYVKTRLPRLLGLASLGTPGPYLLGVTASDGVTPEVSDQRIFDWSGERTLYINLPHPNAGLTPVLLPGRPPAPVR